MPGSWTISWQYWIICRVIECALDEVRISPFIKSTAMLITEECLSKHHCLRMDAAWDTPADYSTSQNAIGRESDEPMANRLLVGQNLYAK